MATATATAGRARGARPGFTAITPYVMTRDVEQLIDFAKQVFGAEETHRSSGSAEGIHCELRIGDSMLMFGGGPEAKGPTGEPLAPRLINLHIYVDDVDAVYQRALDAGAESLGAPADRPYGERAGFVKDSAGNHWYIAKRLGPTYFAEPARSVTPHLYVQRTASRSAPQFIEFVTAAFGARLEARHDFPDGRIGHAVLRIEGAALELGEPLEPVREAPAALYLYVPACDALYDQAIKAGAAALYPVMDQPFGDRLGGVVDPWGNEWFIATHLGRADQ